jgi:hypothetical protein
VNQVLKDEGSGTDVTSTSGLMKIMRMREAKLFQSLAGKMAKVNRF